MDSDFFRFVICDLELKNQIYLYVPSRSTFLGKITKATTLGGTTEFEIIFQIFVDIDKRWHCKNMCLFESIESEFRDLNPKGRFHWNSCRMFVHNLTYF